MKKSKNIFTKKVRLSILKKAKKLVSKGECLCLAISYSFTPKEKSIFYERKNAPNFVVGKIKAIQKEFDLLKYKPKSKNWLSSWWSETPKTTLRRLKIIDELITNLKK